MFYFFFFSLLLSLKKYLPAHTTWTEATAEKFDDGDGEQKGVDLLTATIGRRVEED